MDSPAKPCLSVVVVMTGDTVERIPGPTELRANLQALRRQIDPPAMEILVPYLSGWHDLNGLEAAFPEVRFLNVQSLATAEERGWSREHHDELRAHGAAAAQGRIVAFLEDHVAPDPHWSNRLMNAHAESEYAGIGGAIENQVDRPLHWAAYFCDLGKYQNPVIAGGALFASVVNISYKRETLDAVRPAWRETFSEGGVHRALGEKGFKLALCPSVVVYQHRMQLRIALAVKEFLVWGRSYAAHRSEVLSPGGRALHLAFSPALPALLLVRLIRNVLTKGRTRAKMVRSLPLAALLVSSWSAGEFLGYWTGRPRRPAAKADLLRASSH